MNQELLKNVLEAALMAVNEPLSVTRLLTLFENDPEAPNRSAVKSALAELQVLYQNRGIELKEIASGFRFQVRPDCAARVKRLFDEKPPRYSRALMETLAIIAYRQPLTRAEIEEIRGVSVSSNIVRTLQEREWVRVVGHRDVPGKPGLLATTKQFLDYFNLQRLSELPSLTEIKDLDQANADLFAGLEAATPAKQNQAETKAEIKAEPSGERVTAGIAELALSDADKASRASSVDELDTVSAEEATDNVIPFSV